MINSNGYPCLSLDEVIEALTDVRRLLGHGNDPVWVPTESIYQPISNVKVKGNPTRVHVQTPLRE